MNAKLYPIFHHALNEVDINLLIETYLIQDEKGSLASNRKVNYNKWRQCLRLSLNEIIQITNLNDLFDNRRSIMNRIILKQFIDSIINKKPFQFLSFIRNSICDGHVHQILEALDEG